MASSPLSPYQRQVGVIDTPNLGGASAEAFGADVGRGLREFGASLGELGDTLRAVRNNEQSLAAAKRATDYATEQARQQAELRVRYGSDTDGYAKAMAEWRASNQPLVVDGIDDKTVRARVQNHVGEIDADYDRSDIGWTVATRAKKVVTDAQDYKSASIALIDHQQNFDDVRGTVNREAKAAHSYFMELQHVSPEQREALWRDYLADQQLAVGEWVQRNDPDKLTPLMQGGAFDLLTPEKRDQLSHAADVEIRRRQIAIDQANREAEARQREAEDTMLADVSRGVVVPPAQLAAAAKAAEQRGDSSKAGQLRAAGWASEETTVYGKAPPILLTERLASIEAKKGWQQSPELVARHAAIEKLRDAARSAEPNFTPLNFSDPASIRTRVQDAGAWARLHNGQRPLLLRDEVAELQAMAGQGPQGRSQLAQILAQFPGGDALAAARQVAPRDYALQQAIDLPDGLRKELFQGEEARRHNQGLVKPQDTNEAWNAKDGAGAATSLLPAETRGRIIEAARNVYAFRAARLGLSEFDEEQWRGAINDVLQGSGRGIIGKAKGQAVILPARMAQADFDRRWEALPPLPGAFYGDRKTPIPLAEIKARFRPVTSPYDGRYWLQNDRGEFAVAADGSRALLDIRRMQPRRAAATPPPSPSPSRGPVYVGVPASTQTKGPVYIGIPAQPDKR